VEPSITAAVVVFALLQEGFILVAVVVFFSLMDWDVISCRGKQLLLS
jgi:hypothetical protein